MTMPKTAASGRSAPDDLEPPDQTAIQVIDRAAALLEALAAAPDGLHLAEIARRVGLNRSTAYRILTSLIGHRWVMRDGRLTYRLGFGLFELGSAVPEHHLAMQGAATGILQGAAESLGLNAFVCIVDRDRALFIKQAMYGDVRQVAYPQGSSMPLHASAGPRVLLAHAAPELVERLLSHELAPFTARTPTDPAAMRQELQRIRERGYAIGDGDVTLGMGAIGVPITGSTGRVVAAVSLTDLSQRLFGDEQPRLIEAALMLAADISRELGWSATRGQEA